MLDSTSIMSACRRIAECITVRGRQSKFFLREISRRSVENKCKNTRMRSWALIYMHAQLIRVATGPQLFIYFCLMVELFRALYHFDSSAFRSIACISAILNQSNRIARLFFAFSPFFLFLLARSNNDLLIALPCKFETASGEKKRQKTIDEEEKMMKIIKNRLVNISKR